ncbi:hypothetical protein [Janthinobacterium aquaticum]|uniref:hypothetical protein n=1 Tax=Janthinobacterium sp. FT58W TaxID=2654254 RepID=UPI00186B301D|nr:hypothetical protein [Janthinobacterium sp. FT58W]
MMAEISNLPIATISIDGGTQSRVALNEATVAEYAEVIRLGGELPPVVVFNDGASDGLWLADGFHRFHAHRAAGAMDIACDVRVGTKRDAILHSAGANASHGLRRTNEDKRRAVMTLLADPEWSSWTQGKIAEACGVSREFVSRLSTSAPSSCVRSQDATRTVERNGVTYQQNTANIGKATPKGELATASSARSPESTSNEIRTQSAPTAQASMQDEAPDLAQLADELQKENEAYQRQILSLEADDPKVELVRLNQHLDQLNGRLQGEINTRNEAQKMVKRYAAILEKIRKALNVENNRDILAALGAR